MEGVHEGWEIRGADAVGQVRGGGGGRGVGVKNCRDCTVNGVTPRNEQMSWT
jgi:hypothetical protein